MAAQDLEAGVEQPFDYLIVQNRQAMLRSMDWTLKDNMADGVGAGVGDENAESCGVDRLLRIPLVVRPMLLVDEPGGLAVPRPVCPVLHELRGDGVCREGAQARGASRPASEFVDGSPYLAARVREVDGIDSFLCRG